MKHGKIRLCGLTKHSKGGCGGRNCLPNLHCLLEKKCTDNVAVKNVFFAPCRGKRQQSGHPWELVWTRESVLARKVDRVLQTRVELQTMLYNMWQESQTLSLGVSQPSSLLFTWRKGGNLANGLSSKLLRVQTGKSHMSTCLVHARASFQCHMHYHVQPFEATACSATINLKSSSCTCTLTHQSGLARTIWGLWLGLYVNWPNHSGLAMHTVLTWYTHNYATFWQPAMWLQPSHLLTLFYVTEEKQGKKNSLIVDAITCTTDGCRRLSHST